MTTGHILTTIGLSFTLVGMFVGWIIMARNDEKKRRKELALAADERKKLEVEAAYQRGLHDSEHLKLENSIHNAHDKIREHDEVISSLKSNDAAHAEVHNALLHQMDTIGTNIDTIQRFIMGTVPK